jgi:hypothetical protein
MNRRTVLLSVAASASVGTGCLSAGSGGSAGTPSDPIVAQSFEVVARNQGGDVDAPPAISFEPSSNRVIVTGAMWKGNPCKAAALTDVTYDADADELSVVVGVRKDRSLWERVSGCPDSLGSVQYEAVVEFRDGLPATVTATEQPPSAFESRTTTAQNPNSA